MNGYKPLGGRIFTPPFMFFMVIFLVSLYFMMLRFTEGMGAVSNLNGGFAWGIWVVYDVVIGTAFACGGYALAFTVYIFNKGKYHPLVRPAIVTSLLGYALGGFGAFFDMGRFWQFYEIFLPWNWNFNSVMLEVGLCVAIYILVLIVEFAPVFLERVGAHKLKAALNKVLFIFIALGILLPTMHQSSLGSLLIAMGHKVHPLWQTWQFQPLLALITALTMGFSIVIFEASFTALKVKNLPDETPLLSGLSKAIIGLLIVFLLVRVILLVVQGRLAQLLLLDMASLLYIIETALFVVPLLILMSPARRNNGGNLLVAAVCMLAAGSLYRFDAFLFTFNPGPGYSYFPSVPEIVITLGVISFEIMAFMVLVKILPVLHRQEHA